MFTKITSKDCLLKIKELKLTEPVCYWEKFRKADASQHVNYFTNLWFLFSLLISFEEKLFKNLTLYSKNCFSLRAGSNRLSNRLSGSKRWSIKPEKSRKNLTKYECFKAKFKNYLNKIYKNPKVQRFKDTVCLLNCLLLTKLNSLKNSYKIT